MKKPRLLDLFCCAGGAGMGYARAGFEVTGVDVVRHQNNPHPVIVADALTLDPAWIAANFDAVHASPPCQGYTTMRHALRPEKVPMTDAEASDMIRETVRGNAIRREGSTSIQIVRATERYYGITAQAKKETP